MRNYRASLALIPLFFLMALITYTCHGQDIYQYGLVGSNGGTQKIEGQILIGDSTVIFKYMGQVAAKLTIIKKVETNTLYLTNGVEKSKLVISPVVGRLRGFSYNYALVHEYFEKSPAQSLTYFSITSRPQIADH